MSRHGRVRGEGGGNKGGTSRRSGWTRGIAGEEGASLAGRQEDEDTGGDGVVELGGVGDEVGNVGEELKRDGWGGVPPATCDAFQNPRVDLQYQFDVP